MSNIVSPYLRNVLLGDIMRACMHRVKDSQDPERLMTMKMIDDDEEVDDDDDLLVGSRC